MTPKYKHDCENCVPVGHFFGQDVYFCTPAGDGLPTLLARYGDRDSDYTSSAIVVLKDQMKPGHRISGSDAPSGGEWSMPYLEYVFSDRGLHGAKALFAAAASLGLGYIDRPKRPQADPKTVKAIRDRTDLTLRECVEFAVESGNDVEKAVQMARGKIQRTRPQWTGLDLPPPEPR